MTLRDALAAALAAHDHPHVGLAVLAIRPDHLRRDLMPSCADAILSDPAFREALVEAFAPAAWEELGDDLPHFYPDEFWQATRAIVARMLGDEP